MADTPEVDDLRLVLEVGRTGSVGAAARTLQVSQPSASARLARLERQVGVVLFERDTTGARPTAAGREFVDQAEHALGHLEVLIDRVRATRVAEPALSVGTFGSMAASLFPLLEVLLPDVRVAPMVDHGPVLLGHVAEGRLDAALVGIADQVDLPRGVQAHLVGDDDLVYFRAAGVDGPGRGRTPLRGRTVVFTTYDLRAQEVRERLTALGAEAQQGVSQATTLAMARVAGHLVVVPRSALGSDLREGESVEAVPFRMPIRLSLVTPRAPDERLIEVIPDLGRRLGLRRRSG